MLKKTKRVKCILFLVIFLIGLFPSVVVATAGGVPAGSTLLYWGVGPNQGGKQTSIGFKYSGGFSTDLFLKIPYDNSWHLLNDVKPILEAVKEGYGPNLSGLGGILGTDINFAPNVLAAMKVQSFNPAQIGGKDIPPSSTTLTEDQITWLQKMGYSTTTEQTSQPSTSVPSSPPPQQPVQEATPVPPPAPAPESKVSTQPVDRGQSNTSNDSSSVDQTPSQPAVGETVESPSGQMTNEMVATNQQLVLQHPPELTSTPIPENDMPAKKDNNNYLWLITVVGIIFIMGVAAIFGRKLYLRHMSA